MLEMTDEIRAEFYANEAFRHLIERCLEEEEFVEQFIRLYGVVLPRPPRNGLEAMADEATGYRKDTYAKFFSAFIPFVHRVVYRPLLNSFDMQELADNKNEGNK